MAAIRDDGGPSNQWSEYRREVYSLLDNLDQDNKELGRKIGDNHEEAMRRMSENKEHLQQQFYKFQLQVTKDITALKTKAAMLGAVGGAVLSTLVTVVYNLIIRKP